MKIGVNSPLVTVYIPTRNRERMLTRAIRSVLSQTYQNLELIIVNDNSTDHTLDIINTFVKDHENIRLINYETDIGACKARNIAILNAQGDFVTGLDDDDYYCSRYRIQHFIDVWFENLPHTKKVLYDDLLIQTKVGVIKRKKLKSVKSQMFRTINPIGSQIFALKSTYIECGLFDPLMPVWQDWDMWLRISQMGFSFINIQKFSYTVDKSHNLDRISKIDENSIRFAMNRFISKINYCTEREKAIILKMALSYQNVRIDNSDIICLIKNCEFGFFLKYPVIKFLNYLGIGR